MSAPKAESKITYTSANADMNAFQKSFDAALKDVKARAGKAYPK